MLPYNKEKAFKLENIFLFRKMKVLVHNFIIGKTIIPIYVRSKKLFISAFVSDVFL